MKRFLAMAMMCAALSVLGAQSFGDGLYFAQEEAFAKNGWKYQVVLEVSGGKIVKATWNAVNNLGLMDKKSAAANGTYSMRSASKLGKDWHEQAAAVEAYLVSTQKVAFNQYSTAAGNTDAISGASITVKEFFTLAEKALKSKPLSKGVYAKDGWYFASAKEFDKNGWKDNVLITVAKGTVVDIVWNGVSQDKKKKSKLVEAAKGGYGMGKVAKQGEWDIQAARVVAALLKLQKPEAISVNKDGKTDAISGVSMTVSEFKLLAQEALRPAR